MDTCNKYMAIKNRMEYFDWILVPDMGARFENLIAFHLHYLKKKFPEAEYYQITVMGGGMVLSTCRRLNFYRNWCEVGDND